MPEKCQRNGSDDDQAFRQIANRNCTDPYNYKETIMFKRTAFAQALIILALATSAVLAISPALAAGDAPAGTPSQIDQLGDFLGDSICTGNLLMAMGETPAHATTARLHGEKTLDGNWIVIHYDEDQTAANPKPYHIAQYFGFDSKTKQFVAAAFDNSGSSYSTETSAGWKGDSITFDETPATDRDTFTRNGSKELMHTGTMLDKNKKWVKTDEETCHKA